MRFAIRKKYEKRFKAYISHIKYVFLQNNIRPKDVLSAGRPCNKDKGNI